MLAPPKIGLLPEHLIDQIKAGEVIERPGNLIKEILENSIDAGAKRLQLTLKNNGLDLINLKDDGQGILTKDLPLAFSRHATSKISRFEDLYKLHSFGFRGEALASIAAISKLQCISFNQVEDQGSELRIEGGLTTYSGSRQKNPGVQGTELNIQDLFFNTPVRLKFIQSQQAERNFIKKVIFSFILAHPEIEFVLKFDEDEKEVYPARVDLKERLVDIVPKSQDMILHAQRAYEENELELYIIPGNLRSPVKFQFAYINQRYVLDKQIMRVISNALAASFGHDEFHLLAFIKMPADHIDVNVHPNKTIIKLFETSKVISLITGTIKELAAPNKMSSPSIIQPNNLNQPSFENLSGEQPTLLQQRHEYNMDGIFSPHRLSEQAQNGFVWVGTYFLKKVNSVWKACHAGRLLACYVEERIRIPTSLTIPLLVSEPFKVGLAQAPRIAELQKLGLELEKLSSDTVVLRSIPDWMNGFPLKEIVTALIYKTPLEKISFRPEDWSQATWDEMLTIFSMEELLQKKIMADLKTLLDERLK
jgi:DNA mismatch repair protein MutL